MKEKFLEYTAFLKENFFSLLVLTAMLIPIIWKYTSSHYEDQYKGQIEQYKAQIDQYKVQVETLKLKNAELEIKKELFKNIVIQTQETVQNWESIKSQ